MSAPEYTKEQLETVQRILKIEKTDYYKILSVDKKATDVEIKKSYRKLAIKLHPDKNKHPQSSEAFKKLAKAFEVLGDDDKRRTYDQTGCDPDSRGGMPSASSSGFGGAGRSPFMNMNNMNGGGSPFAFDDDFLNMFFSPNGRGGIFNQGGGGGFGQGFGQGFGPGFTTFQFGGPGGASFRTARPRRDGAGGGGRGGGGARGGDPNQEKTFWENIVQLAPLLIILIPVLFNMLFGDGSSDRLPKFSFETSPNFPVERSTPVHNLKYYIAKSTLDDYAGNDRKLKKLDRSVETIYIDNLKVRCQNEEQRKARLIDESYGWFFPDPEKLEKAYQFQTKSCDRLREMNLL
ncbi:hypothetical protein CANARDRAFT_201341 [[Candida] arabinofermentans NRRL YB-2248]|uniref:J domain-containing protein n=1 Tax=[Candida] arabinofermentans NRRL YB-2248 TaxID=983967 RepID=A0A1E4SXP7_9ASCO|nr:hypothetical protein CANARDRAFT_201341 [[Candida] arabinofermentans NRRL YB-2248]